MSKPKKAEHQLVDLEVFEVSLVSKPAIYRKYLMTKAADGVSEEPNPTMELKQMDREQLKALFKEVELSDKAFEAIAEAMDTLATNKDALASVAKEVFEQAGFDIPVVEKEVVKEVEKFVEVEKAAPADPQEVILKGLPDEARTEVEALLKERDDKLQKVEKAIADAKATAEAEKDLRVTKEFVSKAAEQFPNVPATSDELGPVMKAVDEKLTEEEAALVNKIFAAANSALAETTQTKEFGSAGGQGTPATTEDEIEELAKAMVEKGDAPSVPDAYVKLMDTKPELFG